MGFFTGGHFERTPFAHLSIVTPHLAFLATAPHKWNRIKYYPFFLSFLLIFLSFFFPLIIFLILLSWFSSDSDHAPHSPPFCARIQRPHPASAQSTAATGLQPQFAFLRLPRSSAPPPFAVSSLGDCWSWSAKSASTVLAVPLSVAGRSPSRICVKNDMRIKII